MFSSTFVSTINSSSNANNWGLLATSCSNTGLGEPGFKSDILKNVNGGYIVILPSGSTNTLMPVWLNAGTELKASFYSTNTTYDFTYPAYLPYKSYVNLSIIEFNITQ